MNKKELGKIDNVFFGIRDDHFGIHFTFSGQGWGVCDSKSTWSPSSVKCTEYCKWTEEDRDKNMVKMCRFIDDLLYKAKVQSVVKLLNIPVEVEFEDNQLKSWRILEEVL